MKKILSISTMIIGILAVTSGFAASAVPGQLFCPTNTQLAKLAPNVKAALPGKLYQAYPTAIGANQCAAAISILAENKDQAVAMLKNAFLTENTPFPKNGSAGCLYDSGEIMVFTYSKVKGSCTSSKLDALENAHVSSLSALSNINLR